MDPPLHPGTHAPLTPQDLLPLFPMELIEQEFSPQAAHRYPGRGDGHLSPVARHSAVSRAAPGESCSTRPAHIYYKYEGTSPAGSHKPNTAVPQAYYNKRAGIKRLATETGAGQWGSALSLACQLFGLECTVYMVRVSYDQKPYRRMMMHTWGAEVFPSPSEHTNAGRGVLAATPDSPGQPRDRHQRGGRRCGHPRRHQLRAWQRAESRDAAPDRDRPGSQTADGAWPAKSPKW